MKDYDKNEESSYLKYWDVNNLYEWAMSKKLPVDDFKWFEEISEFNQDFTESYNGESDKGYFLEVDVQYLENIHNLHNDVPFSPKIIKIEKFEKLAANLYDKEEYVIHIRNLTQDIK